MKNKSTWMFLRKSLLTAASVVVAVMVKMQLLHLLSLAAVLVACLCRPTERQR